MQGTLPGLPPATPRWKLGFAWSVRRHEMFWRCRRQFFLEVVAPTLPRAPVHPEVLERLRRLTSVRVLKGQAVHAALEAGIAAARAGQPPERPALAALDQALRRFAVHPADTLVEVVNGGTVPGEAAERARREGRAMVERFFLELWPAYASRRYVQHEGHTGFVAGRVKVRLRPDLVTRGPEGLLISDWKTGRDPGADDSLQLSTYLLWAARGLGEPAERASAEVVLLADGARHPTRRSEAQLAATERRIQASARAMLRLDGFEDATPAPGAHCAECRFATVCDRAAIQHNMLLQDNA